MTNATEVLRRMLDERGVEHTDAEDGHTQYTWWSDGDHEIAASNSGKRLAVYNLTPEQAIAATLGSFNCSDNCTNGERTGTCHEIEDEDTGFIVCSECGAAHDESYTAYYCWCCGRRIEQ